MEEPVVQQRFGVGKFTAKPEALLRHFEPDSTTGRDRFGNRIFTSAKLAYRDREHKFVKAGLLVSSQGEAFIKSHQGILTAIDRALVQAEKDNDWEKIYALGSHGTLRFLAQGSQSRVYRLDTNDGAYVVKIPTKEYTDIDQPYINEMLQVQSVSKDREEFFRDIGVAFPEILFASGQISCMKFEEGIHPSEDWLAKSESAAMFDYFVRDYIDEQQGKNNPLWRNIDRDFQDSIGKSFRTENFVVRPDGTLVWIDPFLYGFVFPVQFPNRRTH